MQQGMKMQQGMRKKTLLEPGAQFGDFMVVALIGRGAMGEVYRVSGHGTDYALIYLFHRFLSHIRIRLR